MEDDTGLEKVRRMDEMEFSRVLVRTCAINRCAVEPVGKERKKRDSTKRERGRP